MLQKLKAVRIRYRHIVHTTQWLCSQTVHVVKFMCNSVESQELTSTASQGMLHLTHADFFGYVTN